MNPSLVKQDLEAMKKAHKIEKIIHLKMIIRNDKLWKELNIPLVEKAAIEESLGKKRSKNLLLSFVFSVLYSILEPSIICEILSVILFGSIEYSFPL